MATLHSIAPPQNEEHGEAETGMDEAQRQAREQSIVPSPRVPEEGEPSPIPTRVSGLPVELDVSIPVRNFRVRNLLALEASHLIDSSWGHGEDVPLAAGEVQLAWSEFEVVDTQMAVRITRLV